MTLRRLAWPVVVLVPVAFLGIFFLWPVTNILVKGFVGGRLWELLHEAVFWRVLWFTVWQAAASTALALVLALPGAHLLARFHFRGRSLLRALATVPFVMPTVVVAGAFIALFEQFGLNDGAFRMRHTVWALLAAHVFFNLAIVLRTVGSYWEGLDGRVEEQARLLGARPGQVFLRVTLPRLAPAVASAASVVFLFCFTSFGVILLLGGPTRATLETEIWRHAVWRGDMASASALAVVQLGAVMSLVLVSNFLQRRRGGREQTRLDSRPMPSRRLLGANLGLLLVALGLPVLVLVERSLATGNGYSFDNYRALTVRVTLLPVSALTALGNSVLFAVVATALAVLVGGFASLVVVYGRRSLSHFFDFGLMLPLGVSAVTLGFGMLVALDAPPMDFRSWRWLVPVAHALIGIPFVLRTVVPTLRRIDPKVRESAALLGASPFQVGRLVDFPLAGRALAVGAAFAFAVSIGEFGATSFLPRHPDRLTAPLALFRLLGTPGDLLRGQAMALAVLLMVLTGLAVLVIEGRPSGQGVVRGDF